MVFEDFEGENLEKILQTVGYLTEDEARVLIKSILKGLIFLQNNRYVHRDLKPASIYIN